MFLGRVDERARLQAVIDGARDGRGAALLLSGEAGIGKTRLVREVMAGTTAMDVVAASGIESELELPFAFLHLLLHRHLARLDVLPPAQARALRAALGLEEAVAGDRFLLGLATLSWLTELADDRPVLCVVDDAQWIDAASADALLFAARRLGHVALAMVFVARTDARTWRAPGIDVLALPPLERDDAVALLDEHARTVAVPTRARILTEARGNPLAIIEFSAAISAHRDGGRPTPVEPLPVAGRVREAFADRIDALAPATRRALQIAAADDTASLAVVRAAAALVGSSVADLEPAVSEGLVDLAAGTIAFRHPLVRAAAYRSDHRSELVAAHTALAEAVGDDLDRRAWHLASAASAPDETIAEELVRAAGRAARRGGSAAAAATLERAAALSTDSTRRGERLVAAARAAFDAGGLERAARLAQDGAPLVLDPSVRAEAAWIDAQVAYELVTPAEAAERALGGVSSIVAAHPEQAVSMLCDAVGCAKDACRPDLLRRCGDLLGALELAEGSRFVPVREAMIGLCGWLETPAPPAVVAMRTLVGAALDGTVEGLVERVLGGYLALIVGDEADGTVLLEALAAETRRRGAVGWLPYAQEPLALALLLAGRFRDAETVVAEALAISRELGQQTQAAILTAIPAWLAAVAGDDDRCVALAATATSGELASHHPTNAALARWALGLGHLARGRFETAADHLADVVGGPARHDFLIRATPDLVEAAVRSGRRPPDLGIVTRWAHHTGHDHAAALATRCEALLADGPDAERLYLAALALHGDAPRAYDRARTALLFGEWLRRARHRSRAREHLTAAHTAFETLGAHGWAARAELELGALGDRPVARTDHHDPWMRLSPQERQVVQLTASGLSNREVAAQLFLSHRTVEHHLRRSYQKLGVGGRHDLPSLALGTTWSAEHD